MPPLSGPPWHPPRHRFNPLQEANPQTDAFLKMLGLEHVVTVPVTAQMRPCPPCKPLASTTAHDAAFAKRGAAALCHRLPRRLPAASTPPPPRRRHNDQELGAAAACE